MQSIELVLERMTTNRIGKLTIEKQIQEIAGSTKNRAQAAGVDGIFDKDDDINGPEEIEVDGIKKYKYIAKIRLEKKKYRSEAAALKNLEAGKKFVNRAAESRGWSLKGDAAEAANKEAAAALRTELRLPPLTPDLYRGFFNGIYERDAHIRVMYDGLMTYKETSGEERDHCLLYGEPAACKSELMKRFKTLLDDDCERVALINAGTISKAGLENWFLEKARDGLLPEVVWFDEIEKFSNENDLTCMLSVMDGQGKIMKLNAKIGKQEQEVRVLVWGTCNNSEKIKKWNDGALWSRFCKKLPCVRPTRALMLQILNQKIEERQRRGRKADKRWAKAALDYAFDVMKTNDPRAILGLLSGRDRLLDGSYFADLEAINQAAELAAKAKFGSL